MLRATTPRSTRLGKQIARSCRPHPTIRHALAIAVMIATVACTSAEPITAPGGDLVRPLLPAAGWPVQGEVRRMTDHRGQWIVQVDVSGSHATPHRPAGSPDLLWHLAAGQCEQTQQGARVTLQQIFYKHTPGISAPGRQRFVMLPLPSPQFDHWRGSPLVLAAFVNGGGPFVACVNLPAGWGDPVAVPERPAE